MASNNEIDRNDPTEPPEWAERRRKRAEEQKAQRERSRPMSVVERRAKPLQFGHIRAAVNELMAEPGEPEAVRDRLVALSESADERVAVMAMGLLVKLNEPPPEGAGSAGEGAVIQLKRHIVDGEPAFERVPASG